ncbi:Hypothetical protein NTJ_09972 [Nesidiocoris tenuis]|uniref:Uncharacterized protein n=1 Tax=Nesidiocoris tenuis TaxID=355587 RepID=A0ABN7AYS2_9HEMI|nr:Hypothetical protein NTJ_09972 [Nesidiocoris tenuis]
MDNSRQPLAERSRTEEQGESLEKRPWRLLLAAWRAGRCSPPRRPSREFGDLLVTVRLWIGPKTLPTCSLPRSLLPSGPQS